MKEPCGTPYAVLREVPGRPTYPSNAPRQAVEEILPLLRKARIRGPLCNHCELQVRISPCVHRVEGPGRGHQLP
jgi:hypothetical protein